MFWDILEIEKTKDIKKITMAYRKKLMKTNPEDKPEEFKELRAAYEQALEYARSVEVKKSPIDSWRDQLVDLYNDFERRIQLDEWKKLLNEDICLAFDKKLLVEETLLKFFMDTYHIPHEVWVYLNEVFDFENRIDELYDQYPKDFIDYVVLQGNRFDDMLPYYLFKPGKDGDVVESYINLYRQAKDAPYEEAKQLIDQIKKLSEFHPYGTILEINTELKNNSLSSFDALEALYEQYPNEEFVIYTLAYVLNHHAKEYKRAEELCRKILEKQSIVKVKWLLVDALGNQERYKEAIEVIHELMTNSGGDQMMLYELNKKRAEYNEFLIQKYERILEEDYENHQNRVDLTWAYLQNDFLDKAFDLSKSLELESMEPFDYYNLMSNLYISKDKFEESIPLIDELIHVILNMEDDGTEKTRKRIKRYPEMLNRKGFCLLALHRDEEGLKVYDLALRESNDDPEILTRVCQIAMSKKKYDQAVDYANRLIKANPQGYHGYLLLSYALFYLRDDRGAFEAVNQSLDLYGGDLESYILKIRIMVRNGAYDGAHEIIDFLDNSGLAEDIQVLFVKGLVEEIEYENDQAALKYYEKVASMIEDVGVFNFTDELYYRILWIKGQSLNANVDKDWKEMMHIIEKGLEADPTHYGLLDYKAWLLMRKEKYKKALKIYLELEKNPNHSADVETQIGYIYYQTLEKNAKLSLEYYLKSIEKEDTGNKRFYTGMCYMYLGQLKEAEQEFIKLQEKNPDGLDSYFRLSAVYEGMNRLEDALENINKTIDIISNREGNQTRYYKAKIRILRRMNRMEEAVELIHFIEEKYEYEYARYDLVKTYTQFGRWDLAKKEFEKWKNEDENDYDPEVEIRMYFVCREYEKAREVLKKYKANLGNHLTCSIEKSMHQIAGDAKGELEILLKQLDYTKQRKAPDLSHIYMNLAQCYFRLHDTTNQKLYAQKALRIINRELKKATLDHALYYGRKAKVLALLGKEKEARENIELAKKAPLCDFCAYCACKDADIYEMNIEEFVGNKEKSVQLAKEYLEKWPDEDDFITSIEYLEKVK